MVKVVTYVNVGPRCCSDEGCRVAIPLQGTREVGLLCFQIRCFLRDVPGVVVHFAVVHFSSHHPTHVKKGLVRCLYDRARNIMKEASNLETEKAHLSTQLRTIGTSSFAMIDSFSDSTGHSHCNHRPSQKAAQPHEPEASVCIMLSGVSLRGKKTDTIP